MNDCDLVKQMKDLIAENEMLKNQNDELTKIISYQKDWPGIRSGIIVPRLRTRYGEADILYANISGRIGDIVKQYLGINRLTEVNDSNYELAKDISTVLVDALCNFEWPYLKEMQTFWEKTHGKKAKYK